MTKLNLKSFWLVLVMLCTSHVVWATTVEEFFYASPGLTIQVTNDSSSPWVVNNNGELVSTLHSSGSYTTISFTNKSQYTIDVSFDVKRDSYSSSYQVAYSTNGSGYTDLTSSNNYYYSKSLTLPSNQTLYLRYRSYKTSNYADCGFIKNLSFTAPFIDSNGSEWHYSINKSTSAATITSYSGNDFALTVPSSVEGYPVEVISNDVFKDNKNLTSVTLPTSLKSIGSSAFRGCTNLISVNIPDAVTTINGSAFSGCIYEA